MESARRDKGFEEVPKARAQGAHDDMVRLCRADGFERVDCPSVDVRGLVPPASGNSTKAGGQTRIVSKHALLEGDRLSPWLGGQATDHRMQEPSVSTLRCLRHASLKNLGTPGLSRAGLGDGL